MFTTWRLARLTARLSAENERQNGLRDSSASDWSPADSSSRSISVSPPANMDGGEQTTPPSDTATPSTTLMDRIMTTERGGAGTRIGSGGDDLPWWFNSIGRFFGILGGLAAIVLGTWSFVWHTMFIDPRGIASDIVLVLAGSIALTVEAPCCCVACKCGAKLARCFESLKFWHKSALFVVLSIPAVAICQNHHSVIGGALLFVAAIAFGLLSLGKKASREEMIENAQQLDNETRRNVDKIKLVFAEEKPATSPATSPVAADDQGNMMVFS
jgi:hypothetical protein